MLDKEDKVQCSTTVSASGYSGGIADTDMYKPDPVKILEDMKTNPGRYKNNSDFAATIVKSNLTTFNMLSKLGLAPDTKKYKSKKDKAKAKLAKKARKKNRK